MFNIGLSTTGKTIEKILFEKYRDAGITHMEISTVGEIYDTLNYKAVKKTADETGIKLWSFHLPFKPFETLDISSSDKEMRMRSVNYTSELIKRAADIGIDKYIVHSGGITRRKTEEEVEERLKYACESYALLSETASTCGGNVCVENLPPVCVGKDIKEIELLLSADDRLRLCFDTNHLLPGNIPEFIHHFADRILTVHISDYDMINERHWLPGEGAVDWYAVRNALLDIGYSGPWLYEISFKSQPTLLRERDLTCEDFVNNAKEIFAGGSITVIPGEKKV